MAKKARPSRRTSRLLSEELDLEAAVRDLSELSIDFDERSQNVPLEGPTGRMMATLPGGDAKSLANAVAAISKDFSLNEICNSGDFSGVMDRTQTASAEMII